MTKETTKIHYPKRYTSSEAKIFLQGIRKGNTAFVLKSLELGTNPNLSTDTAYAIHIAAYYGRHDVLKALLENGAKTDVKTPKGLTALMMATHQNNPEIMETLLENGADIQKTDKNAKTALHYAKDAKTAKILLDNGADIDAFDLEKGTPLHYAIDKKDLKLASYLLQAGANPSALNADGETPLFYAKDVETASLLVNAGVDINAQADFTKQTVLHEAIRNKNEALVAYLAEQGADLQKENANHEMVLEYALKNGTPKMVSDLIRAGADTSIKGHQDRESLYAMASHPKMIEELKGEGLDINAQDKLGMVALHRAPNKEVADMMLKKGADINKEDYTGKTPLHTALASGRYDVAKLLIQKGAKVSINDQYGVTAWEYVKKELKDKSLSAKDKKELNEIYSLIMEKNNWFERNIAQNNSEQGGLNQALQGAGEDITQAGQKQMPMRDNNRSMA
mgnify:CR=1 FL=1